MDSKAWHKVREDMVTTAEFGKWYPLTYFRAGFGVPMDDVLRTEAESNARNLFFITQFDRLKDYMLKKHKMNLVNERENNVSGYRIIHPSKQIAAAIKNRTQKIANQTSRLRSEVKNIAFEKLDQSDLNRVQDEQLRTLTILSMMSGPSKDLKKIGNSLNVPKTKSVPMFATTIN